jgi:hypothetical protein
MNGSPKGIGSLNPGRPATIARMRMTATAAAFGLLLALAAGTAHAADGTWAGTVGGNAGPADAGRLWSTATIDIRITNAI